MSSLNASAEELNNLIQQAKVDETKMEELLEYMKTNEYVKEWAKNHDRISGDDITWIESLTSSK